MGDQIKVNFEAVAMAAKGLKDNALALKDHLAAARKAVGPLYEIWVEAKSPAANAFDIRMLQMERQATQIAEDTGLLGVKLQEAGVLQAQNEDMFKQKFNQLA